MSDVRWPDASAYAMAARDVESFFLLDELRDAQLRKSPLGLPLPATGRNAAVFKAASQGGDMAVRVFTRPPSEGPERYRLIRHHIQPLEGVVFPEVQWYSDAVQVDGQRWPMVRMQWVEGDTLDAWVGKTLGAPERLLDFARRWDELFVYLDHSHIAHGDLQHGNVLVDSCDRVRLVDLDGMWIPSLDSIPAPEFGHVHFQHPGRAESRFWGSRMDGFAALLIGVSLKSLAHEPTLWDRYNDGGNNLIFLADDFEDLERPIWSEVANIDDEQLQHRVQKLRRACEVPCEKLVGPVEMLDDRKSDPAVPGMPAWLAVAGSGPDEAEEPAASDGENGMPLWVVAAVAVALVVVAALVGVLVS